MYTRRVENTSQDGQREHTEEHTYLWKMYFMLWHFIYILLFIWITSVYMFTWMSDSGVWECVWERELHCKSVKEGYVDGLPAYHTPIHLHKSILSERHSKPVIPSSPHFSSSSSFPTLSSSLCQSLHEANPIHYNIIQSLALLFGFSPGAKKAHTGPNWFSCCARFVTVEQKSHCSTASPPVTPPHLPSHMCTQTHTHTSWFLSSNSDHPQNIFFSNCGTSGTM